MTAQTLEKRDGKKEYERLLKEAKKELGGKLDYLDDLPNAPKKPEIPFPYGSSGARPYGWFSN